MDQFRTGAHFVYSVLLWLIWALWPFWVFDRHLSRHVVGYVRFRTPGYPLILARVTGTTCDLRFRLVGFQTGGIFMIYDYSHSALNLDYLFRSQRIWLSCYPKNQFTYRTSWSLI